MGTPRAPHRPPPRVLTLDWAGNAAGAPLFVVRIPRPAPPPPGPLVSTFFMIFVITGGSGKGRHFEVLDLQAGDVHLVPEGVEHQPLDVGDLQGWIVGFDPRLLGAFAPYSPPGRPRSRDDARPAPARSLLLRGLLRLRPRPSRRQRIEGLIAEMDAELREARWGAEKAAHALFVLLITELTRELQEHAPLAPVMLTGLVRDALAFIEDHCLEPLSLQDVAAALGRTPSHLANAIRKETGLTVGDWLREHRMSEARRRLQDTGASIESIAAQVGYADATHFIRTFRQVHGVTPREWRERHRTGT
ncbi:transcriptional regulator, AraC family [Nannocystis exedens]|uniref:Transcriptional regulator, AraC family n=1 Tax=Nannocystis exedens TaxID=54 RepID=A0A1I2BYG3_9BACT|nr:AraC family transcriptional regulator [Nannocystis exedens]PCC71179.1 Multiple antibiotic resistance protein MarA [Nannocystis exedens]SFE61171.1 transcriptional regulator, AraC family [Nannocystis exedens]